ncbi:MAG: metallophosphoesterase [Planctomycetes bacterium]|nr:metallophosphoesterase [Planctomycetota bacterium]
MQQLTRRGVLKTLGGSMAALSMGHAWAEANEASVREAVSVGIVADVHQDVIHDAPARMNRFIGQMDRRKPDYVIQLGDFALPHEQNQPFLDAWNGFVGPRYHVLGNHDTDHGFTKQQTIRWWSMQGRYYSFDVKGWHFVVLDGNDANPRPWSGYNRYIDTEQLAWLEKDLASTAAPTVIYSHQSIEKTDSGVANGEQVRELLEQVNRKAGRTQVFACLSGHHHADYMKVINGIHYLQINSMSYQWLGGKYKRQRFAPEVEKAHPWVSYTAPYRDPLFAVMTLDPKSGTMSIEGMKTTFIPPTPKELDVPDAERRTPTITARTLNVGDGWGR